MTTHTFDRDAAHRRRFDAGMGAHESDDDVIDARMRWVPNSEHPEHFCPRCTGYKGAGAPLCFGCRSEA